MSGQDALERRLIQLEELLSHHEHNYQQLNEVVLGLREEVDALRGSITERLKRLESMADDPASFQRPDERPPHY